MLAFSCRLRRLKIFAPRDEPRAERWRLAGWPERRLAAAGCRSRERSRINIDGALDGALTYDDRYDCAVPRLLLDGFAESMTLSPRVTESPDRTLVAGLIDLPNASLTAKMRPDGAAVGIATVQIEGPRRISIRRFGASEIIDGIDVPPGADVVFSNSANPGEDDATDFALNFLIAEPVPVITRMNGHRPCKQILPHTRHGWQSIGPGCSNTNFP